MIAPLRQTERPRRRRSPLHAARLAVAEALLDDKAKLPGFRQTLARWRVWLVVGAVVVMVLGYVLTLDRWSIDG